MKYILYLFLLNSIWVFSQDFDTIKYTYRTGGEIDSLDYAYSTDVTPFIAGVLNKNTSYFSTDVFNACNGLNPFDKKSVYSDLKFSALPHLGFSYSFSSLSVQFVHFDYQQVFNKSILNVELNRSTSNGLMRNSEFTKNDFIFQLSRSSKRFSYLLQLNNYSNLHGLNGGGVDFNFVNQQGVEFVPVLFGNANAEVKGFDVDYQNKINTIKDSTSNFRSGLISKHSYSIKHRVFYDNTLLTNYFIDSNETNDQYRYAETEHKAGFYIENGKIDFNCLLAYKYWDYQNLGLHNDTSEVSLYSNVNYKNRDFRFNLDFKRNFLGAFGEQNLQSEIGWNRSKFNLNIFAQTNAFAPSLYQRSYFSNKYNYKIDEIELQSKNNLKIDFVYSLGGLFSKINTSAAFLQLKDNYFFVSGKWRNDTLRNVSFIDFMLKTEFVLGNFSAYPRIKFNISKGLAQYVPTSEFGFRLLLKDKLFKAKKLEGVVGIDVNHTSSYDLIGFESYLGLFSIESSGQMFNPIFNGAFFTGFSIEEFRMYLKLENIGYFFNERSNQIVRGYPIQPNFIRLGLTWDFFN